MSIIKDKSSRLQLALDVFSLPEAVEILDQIYPWVDIIELGTPLILSEGLKIVETIRHRFPGKEYLVDLKLMDGGYEISNAAFKSGADIVTVLGGADNKTIALAVQAARGWNKKIMVDLINEDNLIGRAAEMEALGVSILCLHTPFDLREEHTNPLAEIKILRPRVGCSIAVAGGIRLEHVSAAVQAGADIVVVGGGIINAPDRLKMAREIINVLDGSRF